MNSAISLYTSYLNILGRYGLITISSGSIYCGYDDISVPEFVYSFLIPIAPETFPTQDSIVIYIFIKLQNTIFHYWLGILILGANGWNNNMKYMEVIGRFVWYN